MEVEAFFKYLEGQILEVQGTLVISDSAARKT